MFWKRAFDVGIDRSMCKKVPLVQIIYSTSLDDGNAKGHFIYIFV